MTLWITWAQVEAGSLAAPLHQKHGKVRRERLRGELPHHQRHLTPMVSGVVREMLPQLRQADLCGAHNQPPFPPFVCYAIHELDLLSLDFRPLSLHRSKVSKRICIK
jgi:hypothetical protein